MTALLLPSLDTTDNLVVAADRDAFTEDHAISLCHTLQHL